MALISSDCIWCYEQFFQIIYNSSGYIPKLLLGDADQIITRGIFLRSLVLFYFNYKRNIKMQINDLIIFLKVID